MEGTVDFVSTRPPSADADPVISALVTAPVNVASASSAPPTGFRRV